MDRHHLLLTLLVAGMGTAVTVLTAGSPLLYVWWMIAPGLAVIAVVAGILRHRPTTQAPWWVLVAALAMLWLGWTVSALIGAETIGTATARAAGDAA